MEWPATLHIDLDGHMLVVALPRRVAVGGRRLPEHVMRAPRRFAALELGPLTSGRSRRIARCSVDSDGTAGASGPSARPLHQLGVDLGVFASVSGWFSVRCPALGAAGRADSVFSVGCWAMMAGRWCGTSSEDWLVTG